MSTASLSPDGKYVAIGSDIHSALKIFDAESGFCVNELIGHPRIPCKSVWSREYGLLVSACYNVIFWLAM
jgi:WD40 repeat protein